MGLQTKRQGQSSFILDIAMALQLLNGLHRHASLAGQFFAAPAQHDTGLGAVFGGELMKDDLLFYERAHCQRGHGDFSRFDRGGTTILCFYTVVPTAHQLRAMAGVPACAYSTPGASRMIR
ncbi:hypothetical protein BOP93_19945 [Pseudomonas orientalis]|uniref:Uncharacterized protein n=1 Tax=Pseudomonas orientalis TaxID=76758 RepID=A0A2L0S170_9PSED|nr:hypothetical protein BOP93_19945 [Pseudomonas orientalis]